jgi:hypothetical protein
MRNSFLFGMYIYGQSYASHSRNGTPGPYRYPHTVKSQSAQYGLVSSRSMLPRFTLATTSVHVGMYIHRQSYAHYSRNGAPGPYRYPDRYNFRGKSAQYCRISSRSISVFTDTYTHTEIRPYLYVHL